MATHQYRDGRSYDYPDSWPVASPSTLARARDMAYLAVGRATTEIAEDKTLSRLHAYYARTGNYAGALFTTVEPNDAWDITAGDLLAVTTLSIDLTPIHLRLLLEDKDTRTLVSRHLRRLEPNAALTDLEAGSLDAMWDLYLHLKTLLSTEDKASSWWVFAAKLCARKRPHLFPVRDSVVCAYFSGGTRRRGPGEPGNFSIDMQIFADLVTDPHLKHRLSELRAALVEREPAVAHESTLRLLDAALWMYAREANA